jgi:hypothetical protein
LTNIRAAKGWGVQLAYAPVKVKRVWCLEGVSEKERHLVERNRSVGNDEISRLAIVGSADTVTNVGEGALGQKARMQLAVDYKHRAGLGGVDTA